MIFLATDYLHKDDSIPDRFISNDVIWNEQSQGPQGISWQVGRISHIFCQSAPRPTGHPYAKE
jgi:hypothetical protein